MITDVARAAYDGSHVADDDWYKPNTPKPTPCVQSLAN